MAALPMTEHNPYFETIRPTFIENWPQALMALSVPSVGLELDREGIVALGRAQIELFEFWNDIHRASDWAGPTQETVALIERALDRNIARVGGRAFVRLGSRSPKDTYSPLQPMVTSGAQALERFLGTSERFNEDLLLAFHQQYPAHIWTRRWEDIKPYQEFRCFMYERKLLGVSQYIYSDHSQDYDGAYPEIYNFAKSIRDFIWSFFTVFRLRSHLDSVIFDVWVTNTGIRLLEINPYFDLTDPCLFDWRSDPLDATFRYRGNRGQVEKIRLRP